VIKPERTTFVRNIAGKRSRVRKNRNRDRWRQTSSWAVFIAYICSSRQHDVGKATTRNWRQKQGGEKAGGITSPTDHISKKSLQTSLISSCGFSL